ncbi:hypothetical protein CYMTET_25772 [Cymbomonas tetramitiformis]|uniref:Uncharacterized protein n=1 Tax=Cymbomonas tetramitiformis TaxID=36881 RepID=A0AAE0FTF2_9CHLO|nr:hypothetical protein CYMTET_25772 [Cymbomonas tetramitiformis]
MRYPTVLQAAQGSLSTVDAALREQILGCMADGNHCIEQIMSAAKGEGQLTVQELALRRNAVLRVIRDAKKAAQGDRVEGIQQLLLSVAETRHLAPQEEEGPSLLDMIHTIRSRMNHVEHRQTIDGPDANATTGTTLRSGKSAKKHQRGSMLAEASEELRAMLKRRRGSYVTSQS